MTDLLAPRTRSATANETPERSGRPLTLAAAVAGAAAAGTGLLVCMTLGLAGWFGSDAGGYGDTRDALRVGADAWLLAHGAQLELATATITAIPLGLTLLCAFVSFRLGRWAAVTSAVQDDRSLLAAAVVQSGTYGAVAFGTGLLASLDTARPDLGRALVGGVVLATVAGVPGLVAGSGRWPVLRGRLPLLVRSTFEGAACVVLLMTAAASLLVVAALLVDFGAAANVLARLHIDVSAGLLYTAVVGAVAPNAVLLGGAYLLGPGFAAGSGTLVSPSAVELGQVPAFPLAAALPGEGATATWTVGLISVPVLVAGVAAAVTCRNVPHPRYDVGALHGLSSGVVGGVVFAALTGLAGGSVGPGRMSDVGPFLGETLLAGAVAMGPGGLVGGLAMTWWLRRGTATPD